MVHSWYRGTLYPKYNLYSEAMVHLWYRDRVETLENIILNMYGSTSYGHTNSGIQDKETQASNMLLHAY